MDICEICSKIFPETRTAKCAKCSIVFCEDCCEIPISFCVPVTGQKGFYCTKKCILQHHPQYVPDTDLCELCLRVYQEKKILKCANCAAVFCEQCCEIPMNFRVPVTIKGRTKFEIGHYCTEKCMRQHHPGFIICKGPTCEYCHEN